MKKILLLLIPIQVLVLHLAAQVEPKAGNWKTWFISSGKHYRLSAPSSYKNEIVQVLAKQQELDATTKQDIMFWNAGAPGYRWQEIMSKLWTIDTSAKGVLAYMLLSVATYDATIAAWDTKYAYKRPRPFEVDKRIKAMVVKPESPSYPCEYSVAAGVAATIISKFYPHMTDSVNKMARQVLASRVAAGVAFPSDVQAGFDLGKLIAEKEIDKTTDFLPKTPWDGKMPKGPGYWNGRYAMFATAGKNKTVFLDSSSQFRPGPPPDFAKDMEEMKKFKPTFRSNANAYLFASSTEDVLSRKMFEYNVHLNPPRAARMYAISAIGVYDGFVACWDAKYTYWGIRPDQYDTTFKPVLINTPPFPGYPSGHAMAGGVNAELYSYFFPADKAYFDKRAKDGAESRFQGGIHFRTDNEVGLKLGRQVGAYLVQKIRTDGADDDAQLAMKITRKRSVK